MVAQISPLKILSEMFDGILCIWGKGGNIQHPKNSHHHYILSIVDKYTANSNTQGRDKSVSK